MAGVFFFPVSAVPFFVCLTLTNPSLLLLLIFESLPKIFCVPLFISASFAYFVFYLIFYQVAQKWKVWRTDGSGLQRAPFKGENSVLINIPFNTFSITFASSKDDFWFLLAYIMGNVIWPPFLYSLYTSPVCYIPQHPSSHLLRIIHQYYLKPLLSSPLSPPFPCPRGDEWKLHSTPICLDCSSPSIIPFQFSQSPSYCISSIITRILPTFFIISPFSWFALIYIFSFYVFYFSLFSNEKD